MGDRPHALLIPGVARGHWNPMKALMLRLMNAHEHMLFTVMGGPLQIKELEALKESRASNALHRVQCVEGFSGRGDRGGRQSWKRANMMRDDFLGRPFIMENFAAQKLSGCAPTFIVADMFLYWTQGPNVFLLGPLGATRESGSDSRKQKGEETPQTDNSGCLSFLDSRPPRSVLYICFGSNLDLEQSAITELAQGLERSDVSFLWVLPRPREVLASWNVSQVLPAGFVPRTKGKGLVCTGWAPQNEILHHSSVGGFITHCGWNSLLEAICAGVPIIPWPKQAEQKMNARFITSVAKAGVEIRSNVGGEFVGEEIERAVSLLMTSEGTKQRGKMESLRRAALTAVGMDGSSEKALHSFLEEVGGRPS